MFYSPVIQDVPVPTKIISRENVEINNDIFKDQAQSHDEIYTKFDLDEISKKKFY
jgi:hypothetical protein